MAHFRPTATVPGGTGAATPAILHTHVDRTADIDRNGLIEHLNGHGVGTSVHYRPLHTMTHWSTAAILDAKGYDGADRWFEGCVSLPLFPSMTDAEFDHVSDAVAGAFAGDAQPLRA